MEESIRVNNICRMILFYERGLCTFPELRSSFLNDDMIRLLDLLPDESQRLLKAILRYNYSRSGPGYFYLPENNVWLDLRDWLEGSW